MKKLALIVFGIFSASALLAQGPGGPPPPSIPVDGGIIAFLVAAGIAGMGLLNRRKVK